MGEKEVQIKGASLVEYVGSRFQIRSFPAIGTPLFSFPQVERELSRPCCLSHLLFPLLRTEVLQASSVQVLATFVNVFRSLVLVRIDYPPTYERHAATLQAYHPGQNIRLPG